MIFRFFEIHNRVFVRVALGAFLFQIYAAPLARAFTRDYTVPPSGGCPSPNHLNIGLSAPPLQRQWSTSLPTATSILTVAAPGTAAQLDEIEAAIEQTYAIWSGVSGTLLNSSNFPSALGPLVRTSTQNACTADSLSNANGIDTICFNQTSAAFTTGVLSFTRAIVAGASGETFGSAPPSQFPGQIVDADIFFRNDGQATYATPGALATPQGASAYDLESLLAHELGHTFGLDHSGVWRAVMFPYAPSPGTYLGERPSISSPDAPLSDDDRAGIRALYPDSSDALDKGYISGRILPANPFALADMPPTASNEYITGIFGAEVVAVDSATGSVAAATLGGWSCDASNSPAQFDGSYTIGPLPTGHSYLIYAEPFVGLVQATDIGAALAGVCNPSSATPCTVPPLDTNFNPRLRPGP